jgi:hypothetical protein
MNRKDLLCNLTPHSGSPVGDRPRVPGLGFVVPRTPDHCLGFSNVITTLSSPADCVASILERATLMPCGPGIRSSRPSRFVTISSYEPFGPRSTRTAQR